MIVAKVLAVTATIAAALVPSAFALTLSVDDATVQTGAETSVAVGLDNPEDVRALQFTLSGLPPELELRGAEASGRGIGLNADAHQQPNGTIRIVLISLGAETLEPGSGPVLNLKFAVQDGRRVGDVTLAPTDVHVAGTNGELAATGQSGRLRVEGTSSTSAGSGGCDLGAARGASGGWLAAMLLAALLLVRRRARSALRAPENRHGRAPSLRGLSAVALVLLIGPPLKTAAALPQSTNIAVVPGPAGGGHGGTLPTSFAGMTFANLDLSALSASSLSSFDTVALVQVCDVNRALMSQQKIDLLNFISRGGKLIIWDSECADRGDFPPTPDYSWLPFPFTSNNPGPTGNAARNTTDLAVIEQNSLSCDSAAQACFIDTANIAVNTDAVGDMNVMVVGTSDWCIDMVGRNVLGVAGPVQAYQRFGSGLIIWSGLDMDCVQSSCVPGPANPKLAKVWELDLRQPFNPSSGLSCGPVGAKVVLAPVTVPANPPGTTHTVTATVTDASANPVANLPVTFTINGPNAGACPATMTNASGVATCSYTGSAQLGTDIITASATIAGTQVTSNFASKAWGPIKLEPVDASNPVGTSHTVTATVVDLSKPNPPPPLPDVPLTFEVVGANPAEAMQTADANGRASFTYTGVAPGLDAISATVTIGATTYASNFASKRWLALLLEPKTATNPVGTSHTVTATAFDATGQPRAGVAVDFTVSGANQTSCRQTTGSSGTANCTYTGSNAGNDVIVASFVDPSSGQTITSDPAFKTWTAQPVELRLGAATLVPGGRVGIPVFLDNAQTVVRGLQFTITDIPHEVRLSPPPAVQTTARTAGSTVDANQVGNEMRVVAVATGSARIGAGTGQILTLFVDDVSSPCQIGSRIQLKVTDSEVADNNNNPVPNMTTDGSLGCYCGGDVNFDGQVDIFDALRCVDFVIQRVTPSDAERAETDLDGNGTINIFDCLAIVDVILGRRSCGGPSVFGGCEVLPDGSCAHPGDYCSGSGSETFCSDFTTGCGCSGNFAP
jgi:Bacterial Ig-like domain (group 1)/Dockerin type I domain